MSKTLGLLSLFLALNVQADVIKKCSATFTLPREPKSLNLDITVESVEGKTQATVVQKYNGTTSSTTDAVKISEDKVREGLTVKSNPDELNDAEKYVVHAMQLSTDPVFQGVFSAGMDLNQVRSAKMYLIGERTRMGSVTIVEAKDAAGKDMGSYIGGFLVSPCL